MRLADCLILLLAHAVRVILDDPAMGRDSCDNHYV